jgi:hypothetical protein
VNEKKREDDRQFEHSNRAEDTVRLEPRRLRLKETREETKAKGEKDSDEDETKMSAERRMR